MQTFIHIHMQARIKTMYTYGADLLANAVLLVPAHGTAALLAAGHLLQLTGEPWQMEVHERSNASKNSLDADV